MKSLFVSILKWDIASEQIIMTDNEGNQYYLDNCLPADGLDAGRPSITPKYVVLGQLYRNDEDLGPWVLNSDDQKVGELNKMHSSI